jgi:hypothetical protein
MQEGSHQEIVDALGGHRKLKDRIRVVLEKRFELLAPNRKFCDALFKHAPDSGDPLSPFSKETEAIRERAFEHMRLALEGGDVKMSSDLAPHMPRLMWMYQMGLILFWLYDRSTNQSRTQKLMDKSLSLLVGLLKAASLPLMKPLRKMALELIEIVEE